MRILGLVPARSGSKGVPDKNLRLLAGRALLSWTAEAAKEAGVLDRIVLTTDDDRIRDVGLDAGLEVPFRRPAHLAGDTAPMLDVVLHALDELESQEDWLPDAVALLQPTSPLRSAAHIRAATELLPDADSVCSVTPIPKELCPHYVMRIDDSGHLSHFLSDGAGYTRRQDVPQAYRRDGTIYLTRVGVIREHRSLYGERCVPLLIPPEDSLSIDEESDWEEAERRLQARTPKPRGAPAGLSLTDRHDRHGPELPLRRSDGA